MGKATSQCDTTTPPIGVIRNQTLAYLKLRLRDQRRARSTITQDQRRSAFKQQLITLANNNSNAYPPLSHLDFHVMLQQCPHLLKLYLHSSKHSERVVKSLNKNRENLLHTACKNNRSEFIILLLRKGCDPAKQDFEGRTPFHTALLHNHMECVAEFLRFMNAPPLCSNDPNEIRILEGLQRMFRFYTHTGYTIVHLSVLQNLPKVLEDLLKFCLSHGVNVLQSEVLGCGDSLLHLAVKANALEMVKIIVELIPKSEQTRNYPGTLPHEVPGVTEEIRAVLLMKRKRST